MGYEVCAATAAAAAAAAAAGWLDLWLKPGPVLQGEKALHVVCFLQWENGFKQPEMNDGLPLRRREYTAIFRYTG